MTTLLEHMKKTEQTLSNDGFSGKIGPELFRAEKKYLEQLLKETNRDLNQAAQIAGIILDGLKAKIEKYNL